MRVLPFLIHIAVIVALTVAMLAMPAGAFALETDPSAVPLSRFVTTDERIDKLETYLASHNSPLAIYAEVFVAKADQYGLDWRLVAAISGVESTFGKKLPYNSYNAYGWNNGNFYFKSWEDGIEVVSRTLREKYADKWGADTVWEIAPIYAPPSKTWAHKVSYFMEQIERGPKTRTARLPKTGTVGQATLALKLTI